jgi:hypothetical protein
MPRYFFDVYDGEKCTPDHVGLEMEDSHAAQQAAVKALPDVARDVLPDGTRREFVIEVKDEARRPILRARLSLTVETILNV